MICVFLLFFQQKTAYEVRISDWSSDVCSSDLTHVRHSFQLGLVGRGRCPLPSRRNGVASMAPRRRELSLPWPSRRTRHCMPRSGNPGLAPRIVGLPNIDTLTLHHCLRGSTRFRALFEFASNQCQLCPPTSLSAVCAARPEVRRLGTAWVSTFRLRWSR